MNWTHVFRIAWNDYRRMHKLWYALVAFWAIMLMLQIGLAFYNRDFTAAFTAAEGWFFIIAPAVIFAIAWSAVTFASEHEENTFGMLQSLPVAAREVFYGKLFYGLGGSFSLILATAVLTGGFWLVLFSQGGTFNSPSQGVSYHPGLNWIFAGTIPFIISLGLFWSILTKRPWLSLLITGASIVALPLLVGYTVTGLFYVFGDSFRVRASGLPLVVTLACLIVTSIVFFVCDRRLVEAWLPSRSVNMASAANATARQSAAESHRMFWLQRRQKLRFYLGVLVATCVFSAPAISMMSHDNGADGSWLIVVVVLVATILGLNVFRPEHQAHRYRFLSQLGASPFRYWVGTIWIPLLFTAVISGILLNLPVPSSVVVPGHLGERFWNFTTATGCLAIFAVAQFWSSVCRSTILALAATLLTAFVTMIWIQMVTLLRVPWLVGCAPVIALPLWASYLQVVHWFREDDSLRSRITKAVPVVLLVLGVPTFVAAYRVWEVPSVDVSVTPPPPPTPEELVGAQQYDTFFDRLPFMGASAASPDAMIDSLNDDGLIDWVAAHDDDLELLVTTTNAEAIYPPERRGDYLDNQQSHVGRNAVTMLLIAARQAELQKDPQEAWRYYRAALRFAKHQRDRFAGLAGLSDSFVMETAVYRQLVPWCMVDGNTPDQIEETARFVTEYRQDSPNWRTVLVADYRHMDSLLNSPDQVAKHIGLEAFQLIKFAPWETVRTRRLHDYLWIRCWKSLLQAETQLEGSNEDVSERDDRRRVARLSESTLFGGGVVSDTYLWEFLKNADFQRVGVIYQLAAIAHRLQNGSYPDSFDDVSLSLLQDPLPQDPLPQDPLAPNTSLVIHDGTVDEDFATYGPVITAYGIQPYQGRTFSDGEGHLRHFLLPEPAPWDRDRYLSRYERSKRAASTFQLPAVRASSDPYGMDSEGEFAMAFEGDDNPDASLRNVYTETLQHSSEEIILPHLKRAIADAIRKKDLAVLNQVQTQPELYREFLPSLLDAIQSSSTEEAGPLALALSRMKIPARDLAEELATSVSRSTDPDEPIAKPLENPSNGHYYEILEATSWEQALEAASRRTYQGIPGHLATLAEPEEDRFLFEVFGDARVWLDPTPRMKGFGCGSRGRRKEKSSSRPNKATTFPSRTVTTCCSKTAPARTCSSPC